MSYKVINKIKERNKDPASYIKEVYSDNFVEEIKNLSMYLDSYKYIAFDTEFPGVVFQSPIQSREAYYKQIKTNVDKLKLIQLGVTICDEKGNYPEGISTWQFNLKFNLSIDKFSPDSIALLTTSGIAFDILESRGISADTFGEYMISSGLFCNDDLHWISFHGIYDFAYILKYITNQPLPDTEKDFFDILKLYFINFYDIRVLVRNHDNFRGSLMKLGQELSLTRTGIQHQAGSDSLLTSEIYFKLKKEHLNEDTFVFERNILFGLGLGIDENDPFNYYINNPQNSFKLNNNNNQPNNYNYDVNQYQLNMMNMQYNYMRSNSGSYYPANNVYNVSFNNFNGNFPNNNTNTGSLILNNTNMDETIKKFNA